MTVFALLVLSQTVAPKTVLDRYAAYRSAHPIVSADWKVTRASLELAHGTIFVDGTKRVLFKASESASSYSLSETELGGVELVPAQLVYDEMPPMHMTVQPVSRISGASGYIPGVLLRQVAYVPGLKYKSEGKVNVSGAVGDAVSWPVKISQSMFKVEAVVDSEGKIIRLSREPLSGGGPAMGILAPRKGSKPVAPDPSSPDQGTGDEAPAEPATVWTLWNYKTPSTARLNAFLTPIPKGFVPYALPTSSAPNFEVDGTFPSIPWSSGANTIDLKAAASGKPTLIVVTAPDCAPSQKALADLSAIKAGAAGASVQVVSLARTAAGAQGLPFDSTGKASTAIGETSTPLFVLIDGAGKITNLWTGYDHEAEPKFLKEIQEALKATNKA